MVMDAQKMEAQKGTNTVKMLTERELILATKIYASENRTLSWYYTLSTLLLIIICYVLLFSKIPLFLKFLISVLNGLFIVRFFVIYHDYMHKAILQKSVISKLLFTIFGIFILAPASIWQRSHDYHHAHNSKLYTSSIGSFPIVTKKKYKSFSKKDKLLYLFIRHPITITLGYIFAFLWGMSFLSFIRSPKKHWDSAIAIVIHSIFGFMVYSNYELTSFIVIFLLPYIISCGLGTYLFYAQHNFPEATFKDKEGWTYANAALNSSSYMKLNRVMRWFTANIGYHHIHHINHRIPFYRLPEVYSTMKEFQTPKITTLKLKDITKCFRLKVWDNELNKMTGV